MCKNKRYIPALRIDISDEEKIKVIAETINILDDNLEWTNSKNVLKVETLFSELTGLNYAAAVSSGSSAIESSLIALNVFETCIFAPVYTAPATIISCLNNESNIILVDADPNFFSISITDLENKIKSYYCGRNFKNKGVIICVHIGGVINPRIKEIRKLASKYNLYLIEDCAHAHGSYLDSIHAGGWSDVATFSFFLTKTITSGEGGIVMSTDENVITKIKQIRNYGKDHNGLHVLKGMSWRMNEFTAAVLKSRIEYYKPYDRLDLAIYYDKKLKKSNFCFGYKIPDNMKSGYYKYIVMLNNNIKFDYIDFQRYMKNNGIILPAKVFERLIVEEPYLSKCKNIVNINDQFCGAEFLKDNHFCLPIYSGLQESEIDYIIDKIYEYETDRKLYGVI